MTSFLNGYKKGGINMHNLLNKFLGMNAETRERTVAAVVIYILNLLVTFHVVEFSNEQIEAIAQIAVFIAAGIAWWFSHYYNNDYTEVAARHTGAMRQEKLEQKENYVGDKFYSDESYDDSVEEEEDADEYNVI